MRSAAASSLALLAVLSLSLLSVAAAVSSSDYLSPPTRWALREARAEERKNALSRALIVVPQSPDYAAIQLQQTAHVDALSAARARRENEARSHAVSICMNVLDEEIDIAQMKRLETGIAAALAETKEKLKLKPKSKFLNAKLKCLKKASKFHGKALATISDQVAKAKAIEKDADKAEVDLLNLPCELEEGDHVEKCEAIKCRKKGLRKRERNAKEQARLWYRMKTLDLRIYRYKAHIAKMKETKSCPRRRVDVYHHGHPGHHHQGHHHPKPPVVVQQKMSREEEETEDDSSFAETESALVTEAQAEAEREKHKGQLLWEEDYMMCLDRAEARVDAIKFQISRMLKRVEKLASLAIPLTCGDKAKSKMKFPPECPKPPAPPPKPLPKVYKPKTGKFGHAVATASGDPHVDTFDGVHHDTMIAGWFTWAKNPVINLQAYSQLGCMPPSVPNTCLRAFSLKIVPPGSDEWLMVSWGLWPPQNHIQNVVVSDSFGRNINKPPAQFPSGLYLGGKYKITMAGRKLMVQPAGKAITDPNLALSFSFADYFMQLSLPRHAPHFGTNGLFGHLNPPNVPRTVQNQLRFFGGRPSNVDNKALCQRCSWEGKQTPQIFEWAATHVVTSDKGKNPPVSPGGQAGLKQQKFLNTYHQKRVHKATLLQLSAQLGLESGGSSHGHAGAVVNASTSASTLTSALFGNMHVSHLTAEQRADLAAALSAEFSPVPVANKPKTFPSVVPKANREDLQFCRLRLKKIFKLDKLKKERKQAKKKGWWHGKKCLSEAEAKKIKDMLAAKKAKVQKMVQKYHESLNSCLQDVKSQAVAKSVIKGQKDKKKEKAAAKKKQKKAIQKKEAKKRAIKRAIKKQKQEAAKAEDPNAIAKAERKAQKRHRHAHEEHEDMDREMRRHKHHRHRRRGGRGGQLKPEPCPAAAPAADPVRQHEQAQRDADAKADAEQAQAGADAGAGAGADGADAGANGDAGSDGVVNVGDTQLHIHVTQHSAPEPDVRALAEVEQRLSTLHESAMGKVESLLEDVDKKRCDGKPCLHELEATVQDFKEKFLNEAQQINKVTHKFSYADDAPTLA